jgi:hypothetical protein
MIIEVDREVMFNLANISATKGPNERLSSLMLTQMREAAERIVNATAGRVHGAIVKIEIDA